eukprot:17468-Prymnesium_polylepis.2
MGSPVGSCRACHPAARPVHGRLSVGALMARRVLISSSLSGYCILCVAAAEHTPPSTPDSGTDETDTRGESIGTSPLLSVLLFLYSGPVV